MKIKQLLLTAFAIGTAFFANAQVPHRCSAMEHRAEQISQNPQLEKAYQKARSQAAAYLAANPIEPRSLVTIPVVVHVVYRNAAANISVAQIQSQLDVLNEDFGGRNADSTLIPTAFKRLFANARIQFCLAKQDPTGAATTGIIRKTTTTTSFNTNDNVKRNANGGDDAWDASKYLNLWVCDLGTSLLGYAQFPGGPAATDGVVIHYKYFGRNGTAVAPYNKGRTATHEVGHWIGLYHIDGDATCGNDGIADTPTQNTLNYGCPNFPQVTCGNGPNGDMFMNYMDYVDDNCMQMFTFGQGAMARSVMNTSRASLITSPGCIAPTLAADDGALMSLVMGASTCAAAPSIVFKNAGNTIITTAEIQYTIDGGAPISYTYTGNLASMASANITLPVSGSLPAGRHDIVVTIITVNGNPDASTNGNNVQTDAFSTNGGTDSETSGLIVASSSGCSLDATPSFTFKNTGCSDIATADFSYTIDGGATQTYTFSGTIVSGATTIITLPQQTLTMGAHTVVVNVVTINSITDANATTANTVTKIFTLSGGTGSVLASQGFQGTFPPAGYTINNPDAGSITWTQGTKGKGSTKSAFLDFFNYGGGTVAQNGHIDDLNLPIANIAGIAGSPATTIPALTFDVAYAYYSIDGTDCNNAGGTAAQQLPCSYDTLLVRVSTDCGASWTEVYRKQKDLLATAPATQTAFAPTATQWRNEQILLDAYANSTGLQIQFRTINNYENSLYVDNINLTRIVATEAFAKQNTKFKLQPNPANDYTRVILDSDIAENISLNIYDAMGKIVRTQTAKTIIGHNEFVVETQGLPSGCYYLSLQSNNIFGSQKLVVY